MGLSKLAFTRVCQEQRVRHGRSGAATWARREVKGSPRPSHHLPPWQHHRLGFEPGRVVRSLDGIAETLNARGVPTPLWDCRRITLTLVLRCTLRSGMHQSIYKFYLYRLPSAGTVIVADDLITDHGKPDTVSKSDGSRIGTLEVSARTQRANLRTDQQFHFFRVWERSSVDTQKTTRRLWAPQRRRRWRPRSRPADRQPIAGLAVIDRHDIKPSTHRLYRR